MSDEPEQTIFLSTERIDKALQLLSLEICRLVDIGKSITIDSLYFERDKLKHEVDRVERSSFVFDFHMDRLQDDEKRGPVLFDLVHYAMAAFGGAVCCSVTHSGTTRIDIVNSQMQLKPAKYTSFITVDKNNISAEGSDALLTDEMTMQKVTEAIRQNLGTSPSEMSKDVVLTLSLVFDSAIVVVSLTECPDSEFNPEAYLKDPKRMRSNTTNAGDLEKSVFLDAILPGACPACPSILTTSLNGRHIRSVQQSHGNFVGIEYNTEENDDTLEENYMTVYVKMINGKTISIKYHRNMTAAVISDEVERRTLIPRDMIRLVHEVKTTIEMSLRSLGGMEANEQMDTQETEKDRENKRKLEEGKEGKATKPTDDMVYLKRHIMEALKRSDGKMDGYSRKTYEK